MRGLFLLVVLSACAGRPAAESKFSRGATDCPPPDVVDSASTEGEPEEDADSAEDADSGERGPARVLTHARLPGHTDVVELRVEEGRIVELGPSVDHADAEVTDAGGRFAIPGVIDSHVHLAYLPMAAELAAGGVVAAVDLAAPVEWLAERPTDLQILASGPMITAPSGYPTTSWGRNGYGLECATREEAVAAVDQLVAAGAGILKVPLNGAPELSDDTLAAVAERAHHHGIRLGVHALSDSGARRAAQAGADVLVHIPTEPLSEATVAAWADGAVVPTLAAFGNSTTARSNLAQLREAGTTILYGTDFGNAREVGISVPELEAMAQAGLSPTEILASATSAPAEFWGFSGLGMVEEGALGVVVLVEGDPTSDTAAWTRAVERWPPLD